MGKTPPGNLFRRRQYPPVGFANEDNSSGAQALLQKLDRAGDSSADPGGADTGGHIDLLIRNIAGSIAMDELDLVGYAKFFRTQFRLCGKQLAHIDADAGDAVIASPGAQHLARTAAQVEHSVPRFQAQRRTESGELFGCDRVVDAVSTLSDIEDPWNVQCGKSPLGGKLIWARLTTYMPNISV